MDIYQFVIAYKLECFLASFLVTPTLGYITWKLHKDVLANPHEAGFAGVLCVSTMGAYTVFSILLPWIVATRGGLTAYWS